MRKGDVYIYFKVPMTFPGSTSVNSKLPLFFLETTWRAINFYLIIELRHSIRTDRHPDRPWGHYI